MSNHFHIYFMPWLSIYSEVTLGRVTFWNFSREADEKIESDKIRKRLDTHFKSYKSRSNASINDITICSFEGNDFNRRLSGNEEIHLQEAVTALAFASIINMLETRVQQKQLHHKPPSVNSFELMYRCLDLNSNDYSHITPSLKSLGLNDSEHYFQEPLVLRGDAYQDRKWIDYLNAYLFYKKSNKLRNKISRGLEFFKLSHAQYDVLDYSGLSAILTRIALITTAFESLLEFDINSKANYFADYINDRFRLSNSRRSTRKFWNKNRTKFRKVTRSTVGWWAYDFYKLRNSVIHGDKIKNEKLKFKKGLPFNQMDVADLVFADCLEEIILSEKILKIPQKTTSDLLIKGFEDAFLGRGVENWKKHHKTLGWIK